MTDRAPQDNDIRRAMDACLPGLENRPDFDREVLRRAKGEANVKKKLSVGLVLAIVLVLAAAATAVAITLNLFEVYGQKDKRLAEIAPSTVITPVQRIVTSEDSASSVVTITNAYYDGNSLLFSYTVENPTHADTFIPTDEQRAKMEPTNTDFSFDPLSEREQALAEAYRDAKQSGTAFGVMRENVYLSPDTYAENGLALGSWNEFNEYSSQTLHSCIRDFDSIPQETRGLDRLNIRTAVCQSTSYFYFDGEKAYIMETQGDIEPISVEITRAQSMIYQFSGDTVYHGLQMHCDVETSDVHLSARITLLDDQSLPELPEGSFYDMCLQDADGMFIEASSMAEQRAQTLRFVFNGTGKRPDIRMACLLIIGDSGTESIDFVMTENE